MVALKVNTKVAARVGEAAVEKERFFYVLPQKDGEFLDLPLLFQHMQECRDTTIVTGRTKIGFLVPPKSKVNYIRKMAETIFRGTQVKIKFARLTKKEGIRRKRGTPEEGILIIKKGESSYADLVKGIRQGVDIDALGVSVKTIRKTQTGDVLMRINGGKTKVDIMKEAIGKKLEGARVVDGKRTSKIYITDVDISTTKTDVIKVLENALGTSDIQISALRPTRDGNQTATVELSTRNAKTLVSRGKLKIGWVECRVREKPHIPRCYKCLEFGHLRGDCAGPDRTKACLNVAGKGTRRECVEMLHTALNVEWQAIGRIRLDAPFTKSC